MKVVSFVIFSNQNNFWKLNIVITITTTPEMPCYTKLWKFKILKCCCLDLMNNRKHKSILTFEKRNELN